MKNNHMIREQVDRNLTLCPSGRPEIEDSRVFGIVTGTAEQPQVNYLKKTIPLDEELLSQTQAVTPTEVFRIASPCQANKCVHFDGQDCRLVMRVADQLPHVTETLPPCAIRRDCRWWKQEGKSACMRCPQILTDNYHPTELEVQVSGDPRGHLSH
ncbi:hypothetical protein SPB21_34180 [Leptothoe sp. ISB3NOV94-8A]|nr:nitrogen fixation protein [Adonisia turfae]MDV3348620.1 nitrogen fixation protein [Leptothoe sp. LEGE 181152]